MLARPPTAVLVMGAALVSGTVVEVLEAVAGALGTREPADARPVAGSEARLSLPVFCMSVVTDSVVAAVVCGVAATAPRIVVCAGRFASFRGSGRGAGVDEAAAAVGGKLVAGSSGRRSDA